MNIDDLVKLLSLLKTTSNQEEKKPLGSSRIGAYVICRSRNEGVNAGYIEEIDSTGIVLSKCRRLWSFYPKEKNLSWYEGVAESGLSSKSKVSGFSTKVIIEDFSITECTESARLSIMAYKTNVQN